MKKIWISLKSSFYITTSSIAFIPALFAVCGFLLSLLTVAVEYDPFMMDFKKSIDFLLVSNIEEGRLILGTLVASTISLMVFSFSMVMIVLSQASSSLSPRVLPGLISNKPHQIILGSYLGTIIYCLIMIVNFQSDGENQMPTLGILMSMVFGITCLSLFVYFIHSISKSIQVETILNDIFNETLSQLKSADHENSQNEEKIPQVQDWEEICTIKSGYLKNMAIGDLMDLTKKHDIQVNIRKHISSFLVEGYPFLKIKSANKLSDDAIENIRACFTFYIEDQVRDHYIFGFKQISEIATKALSPGINDPGTAIKALDLLSVLFIKRMQITEPLYELDEDDNPKIFYSRITLEELIFQNLIPIREFGKSDVLVMMKLLEVMKNMVYADREKNDFTPPLAETIKSIIECADKSIKNPLDRSQINSLIQLIDKTFSKKQQFRLLD